MRDQSIPPVEWLDKFGRGLECTCGEEEASMTTITDAQHAHDCAIMIEFTKRADMKYVCEFTLPNGTLISVGATSEILARLYDDDVEHQGWDEYSLDRAADLYRIKLGYPRGWVSFMGTPIRYLRYVAAQIRVDRKIDKLVEKLGGVVDLLPYPVF